MDDEIELIRDGDGFAVIGTPKAVESFLFAQGLSSQVLDLTRLSKAMHAAGAAGKAGAEISAHSARWVKLTKESAELYLKLPAMKGSAPGVARAILTKQGKTKKILEIVQTRGLSLTNPALLTGIGGLMTQMALQQSMAEITDYLAVIDKKVVALLRNQTDAAFADLAGAESVIGQAFALRESVGGVSDLTWSKVAGTWETLAAKQDYALRQLRNFASDLEGASNTAGIAKAFAAAEVNIPEWLTFLARCVRAQDAFAILELDRVLAKDTSQVENHLAGLRSSRLARIEVIDETTHALMKRLDVVAREADNRVLLHPIASAQAVNAGNRAAEHLDQFQQWLGVDRDRQEVVATRWARAAAVFADKVLTDENVADATRLAVSVIQAVRIMK